MSPLYLFWWRQILAHFKTSAILPHYLTVSFLNENQGEIPDWMSTLFLGLCKPPWDKVLTEFKPRVTPGSQTAFPPIIHKFVFCLMFLSLCLDPTVIGATKVHRWTENSPWLCREETDIWSSRGSLSKGHRAHQNSKGESWRLGQIRPSVVAHAREFFPD